MLNGLAGSLRLDGGDADPAAAAAVDAMAAAMAHRGLLLRRVHRDGPLAMALPVGATGPAVIDGAEVDLAALQRAHGADLLEHIDGAFALALWDPAARTLLLARDRAGIRPLFVARARPGLLLFASELKGLLAHPECPRDVDWLGVLARFALPMRSFAPCSWFRGIDPIVPGGLVRADARAGTVESRRWWSLRFVSDEEAAADQRSDHEIIAGYRERLAAAVRAAADGPAALFLSGGIDSIAIAALAPAPRPETFTVLTRSTLGNGDAAIAVDAAAFLGVGNHQVVSRRGGGLTPELWKKTVWMTESPTCRAQHWLKSELARRARQVLPDARILLHGEGSDEMVGADTSNWSEHRDDATYDDYIAKLREMQRDELFNVESLAVERAFGGGALRDEVLARASGQPLPRHPMQRRAIYCLEGLDELTLWRDDRLAAFNGFEARAPFVDHRLLEYVAAIPPRAHASLFWKKRILRDALAAELPERLRLQRKIPFYAGTDARFTTRMLLDVLVADGHALIREAFGDADRHPVLAPGFIGRLLAECERDPGTNLVEPLLLFVNLGLLEGMARDAAAGAHALAAEGPPLVTLDRWDAARAAELFAEAAVDVDRPLALGPGIELARPEHDPETMWVVVRDEVKYVIDGDETRAWREVLRRVDGTRPLRAILAELGLAAADIRKHLDEALEFEVVALR